MLIQYFDYGNGDDDGGHDGDDDDEEIEENQQSLSIYGLAETYLDTLNI